MATLHDGIDPADAVAFLLCSFSPTHIATVLTRQTGNPINVGRVESWIAAKALPPLDLLDAIAVATETPVADVRQAYRRARFARRYEREPRKPRRLPQADLQQAS